MTSKRSFWGMRRNFYKIGRPFLLWHYPQNELGSGGPENEKSMESMESMDG